MLVLEFFLLVSGVEWAGFVVFVSPVVVVSLVSVLFVSFYIVSFPHLCLNPHCLFSFLS